MTQAVHVEHVATALVSNNVAMTTQTTLAAATITGAGFAANDDCLLLAWLSLQQANTATLQAWRIQYAGATITNGTADPRTDCWPSGASEERMFFFMARVNLGGSVGDFTVQNLRAGTSANVTINAVQLILLRLSDFGTEDVDWRWNKSTTNVQNTTTYSGTSRATETWTPAQVEDWVAIFYVHTAIDSTSINAEGRLVLDSVLETGDWSIEGWDTTEELTYGGFSVIQSLSVASHTLTVQTRDDQTGANDHRESALFVFRKAKWADIYVNEPATQTAAVLPTGTQIATITDTLSTTQDVIVMGQGNVDINVVSGSALWVKKAGTALTPDWQTVGSGDNTQLSNDTTDELPEFVGYLDSSVSGALDYDMFCGHYDSGTKNVILPKLLAWGMELAAAAAPTSLPVLPARSYMMNHLVTQH